VFAAGHLPGTLNLELGQNLTTYLGWLVPWESEFVLLADEEEEIAEARRLLARIGRDELYARAIWSTAGPTSREARGERGRATGRYEVASFSDLARAADESGPEGLQVLDVRHPHEWRAGHLASARLLPLPELAARRHEIPPAGKVWLYCGAGYRAAVAASLLSGWGASPVLVDDAWENALSWGLAIEAD
jgi:rhodanese-related sulfurtransferase